MKEKLVVLLIVFLMGGAAMAQKSPHKLKLGIRAGVNLDYLRLGNDLRDLSTNQKVKPCFVGGLTLQANFGKFMLQPELLLNNRGTKFFASDTSTGIKQRVSYITVPLMLGFRPFRFLSLEVGPEAGFLLYAKERPLKGDGDAVSITNDYQRWDYGVNFGASVYATKYLGLSIRYYLGLADILAKGEKFVENAPSVNQAELKNRTLQISLSFYFLNKG